MSLGFSLGVRARIADHAGLRKGNWPEGLLSCPPAAGIAAIGWCNRPRCRCQRAPSEAAELGERFEPLVGDVGDWNAHERAADAARVAGELRYWVNNAGVDWVGAAHEIDLLRQRCRDRGRRRGARAVLRLSAPGCRRRDLNISIDDVYSRV